MDPEFEPPRQAYSPAASRRKRSSRPAKKKKAVVQVSNPELDALRAREAAFIVEMSRLKGAMERFRSETAELRRESEGVIRELDEDRKNARARIARLEDLIRTRPKTMWERIKAAFGVLAGQSSAIPLLPAPREDLQRAA